MRRNVRSLTMALTALDLGTLITLWPKSGQLLSHLRHPRGWVDSVGADAAALDLAHAGLFLAANWLAAGLLGALASNAPGVLGRAGSAVAHRLLPGVLRRVVIGSLGAGLAVGAVPMVLGSAPAGASAASRPVTVSAPVTPGADWPTDGHDAPPIDIPWPGSTPPPATRTPQPGGSDHVTVRAGDSLWLIAARRLGPAATDAQIATAWPSWYRANAAVIGTNPALLQPGQILAAPATNGPS